MVIVKMTDDLYRKFLVRCDFEDAGSFTAEYPEGDPRSNIQLPLNTIKPFLKENTQNEEDNKCIALNRDDFELLLDRVSRLEETVYDRLDERINNLRDQNRALINAINAYASTPLDVFKLQEQVQHSNGSTVNPNKFNPGLCDT